MTEIIGTINIYSSLQLDELAHILSQEICGGIIFGGKEESIREEVPAVYTKAEFLGIRLVLFGVAGDYGLSAEQWDENVAAKTADDLVDISGYLAYRVNKINGLKAW